MRGVLDFFSKSTAIPGMYAVLKTIGYKKRPHVETQLQIYNKEHKFHASVCTFKTRPQELEVRDHWSCLLQSTDQLISLTF